MVKKKNRTSPISGGWVISALTEKARADD